MPGEMGEMCAASSQHGCRECAASATGAERKRFVLSYTAAFMHTQLVNGAGEAPRLSGRMWTRCTGLRCRGACPRVASLFPFTKLLL